MSEDFDLMESRPETTEYEFERLKKYVKQKQIKVHKQSKKGFKKTTKCPICKYSTIGGIMSAFMAYSSKVLRESPKDAAFKILATRFNEITEENNIINGIPPERQGPKVNSIHVRRHFKEIEYMEFMSFYRVRDQKDFIDTSIKQLEKCCWMSSITKNVDGSIATRGPLIPNKENFALYHKMCELSIKLSKFCNPSQDGSHANF